MGKKRITTEERIKDLAMKCYGIPEGHIEENNWNHIVIKGLCSMIIKIWVDWKEDTRHYQPSRRLYERYLDTVSRGEHKLDPDSADYETAVRVVNDCRKYLNLVVRSRVRDRTACRVF